MPTFLFTPTPNKVASRFIQDKAVVAREVFDGLLPELRGLAVTITGIENVSILKKARDTLATLPAGADWDKTKKTLAADLVPYLGEEGGVKRAELLLRTHGFSAYSAAQYQVLDRQRDVFPWWQYASADDLHVRPTHAALDGCVFPADSEFWKTHFPPWEFGCRCRIIPLTEDDVNEIRFREAKRVPEARRVIEGDRLKRVVTTGQLTLADANGIPQQLDVRSPREKQGGSGFYHNPGDLHLNLDDLRAQYSKTPEGAAAFEAFEAWAGKTSLGKGRGSVLAWLERTIPGAPVADFPADLSKLKSVKKLGGSTGATLVEAPGGRRFVQKRGNSAEHLREEILADELYRAAGLDVPEARLYDGADGRPVKLAKFIDGQQLGDYLKTATPEQAAAVLATARKGFVADALLGNYDVAGLGLDNLLVDKTGKVWRIDNGGSLRFRAQGAKKDVFGAEITELATLRDPKVNAATARIFAGISEAEIATQARDLIGKRAALLAITPPDLRGVLEQRFADLERRFPLVTSGFTPEFADQVSRARILGKAHLGDGDKVEDLQVLWYHETRGGQDYTVARFKMTPAGGTAVREAHKELKKLKTFADPYWNRIEPIIKTVAAHAADGKYNPQKVALLQSFKADLAKEDPALKAHYSGIVAELEAAMQAKRAPALLKAYTPPPTKLEASKADLTLAQSPWAYVAKNKRRGFAEATGQQIYQVKSALAGQHAPTGAEIRAILPDDLETPFALRGIVEVAIPGRGGLETIEKAASAAKAFGIDVAPATPARRELTYLSRNLSLLHKTMEPGARAKWEAIAGDESVGEVERATRLRTWVKDNLGVDVTDGRAYAADGKDNTFGNGWRHWDRWDLPRAQVEKEMKGHTLHHNLAGDLPTVIDSWLNGGGQITPTVERLRIGVPISDGMSPSTDLGTGGASYFFTRIKAKASAAKMPGLTFKVGNLARIDAVSYDGDRFGDVRPAGENTHVTDPRVARKIDAAEWKAAAKHSGNETIFKNGFHLLEDIETINARTALERDRILETFKSHGYEQLPDGRPLADIVRVAG